MDTELVWEMKKGGKKKSVEREARKKTLLVSAEVAILYGVGFYSYLDLATTFNLILV